MSTADERSAAAWERVKKDFYKPGSIGQQIAENAYRIGWIDGQLAGLKQAQELVEPATSDLRRILEGV